jgi:hypothetical protein
VPTATDAAAANDTFRILYPDSSATYNRDPSLLTANAPGLYKYAFDPVPSADPDVDADDPAIRLTHVDDSDAARTRCPPYSDTYSVPPSGDTDRPYGPFSSEYVP